jgi:hypothetical protein
MFAKSLIASLTFHDAIIYCACVFCKGENGMKQDTGPDGVPQARPADYGCAYILDAEPAAHPGITQPGSRRARPAHCGLPRRPGSDYCEAHYALCHLRPGSRAEAMKGFAIEALADAVGGRQARPRPGSLPGSLPG